MILVWDTAKMRREERDHDNQGPRISAYSTFGRGGKLTDNCRNPHLPFLTSMCGPGITSIYRYKILVLREYILRRVTDRQTIVESQDLQGIYIWVAQELPESWEERDSGCEILTLGSTDLFERGTFQWLGKEPLSDWLTDGGKRQRSGGGQVEDDLTYQQHLMAFNSAIVKVMNRVTDSFLQYLPRGNYHSKYILPIELFLNFLSRFTFFRLNFTYPNLRT